VQCDERLHIILCDIHLNVYLLKNKINMSVDQILSAIGLIGLGGVLKSVFDFLISNKKAKHDA